MSSPLRWRLICGSFLIVGFALVTFTSAQKEDPQLLLEKATKLELVDGDLKGAIATYERILGAQSVPRVVAARALLHLGECHEKLGHAEARKAYERLVREFADQTEEVGRARARLAALGERDTAMRVRQVWTRPFEVLLGAPTRDGRYVTFQDWESLDLAVVDLATGEKRRLTSKGPQSLEFALLSVPSPDGLQVAYTWYNENNVYDLRIVGMDGSNPRVLYVGDKLRYLDPTDWSPDGESVLAVLYGREAKNQLVLLGVKDGSVKVLKAFDRHVPERPRFSPDGRFIAYGFPQGARTEELDIFVLAVDGGRETPLVQHPANDRVFDWTPDGKRLLFGSDRSGAMSGWWIPVADGTASGAPELVKPDLGEHVGPMGFTRDGSYYYAARTGMTDVFIAELDPASGTVSAPPVLATQRFVGSNSRPDWSSDGKQLVYLSKRGPGAWGARAICVRDTETGEVRELASKLNRVVWVRWSPDGRSLLVTASVDDRYPICRIDVQTGDFECMDLEKLGWVGAWSADGKAIFYHHWDSSTNTASIVARDLATGRERTLHSLARPSHYSSGLALSRDGRQLAFASSQGGTNVLKALPVEGGQARDVLREAEIPVPGSVAWTPDGLSLLFTRRTSPRASKTDLWRVPAQGGEPQKLRLGADHLRDLCIHPDGRHIAYTSGGARSEIWALESFLPAPEAAVAR